MKTFIFNMSFTLPPMIEMTEVVQETQFRPSCVKLVGFCAPCQEADMKSSIFDMNFTLPPLVEMTEVEKGKPTKFTDMLNCRSDSDYCTAAYG